jgi:hypothetical protein
MRTISISTDVFAAIWRSRTDNETNEDEILRRVLGIPKAPTSPTDVAKRDIQITVGFHDPRYGVELEPGFRIFRTYKGTEHGARAIQGFWVLDKDGKGYPTLNELSAAIGIPHENAWTAWFYRDKAGQRRPVSHLRDQSKIIRRNGGGLAELV